MVDRRCCIVIDIEKLCKYFNNDIFFNSYFTEELLAETASSDER
jgi:hypothetical protein